MSRLFRVLSGFLTVLFICSICIVGNAEGPVISIETCAVSAPENQEYTGFNVEPSITVTDGTTVLTNGVDYSVKYENNISIGIASVIVSGIGNYTDYVATSFQIVPATVTGIKQTAKTNTTVTIKWNKAPFASEYVVKDTVRGTVLAKTSKTKLKLKNLSSSKVYQIAIGSNALVDSTQYSGYYTEPYFVCTKVKKVKIKSAAYKSRGKIKVSWKRNNSVDGYKILLSTSKTFIKNKNTVTVTNPKKISKTISNLKKGTYYVKVRSFKNVGNRVVHSGYSAVKKVKVLKSPKVIVAQTSTAPTSTNSALSFEDTVTTGSRTIVQTVVDQAETLYGGTTDDKSRPTYGYLPLGTLDYADDKVISCSTDSSIKYRLLNCGQRVYVKTQYKGENIHILKGTLPETNSVTANSLSVESKHTVITLDTYWKAPFLLTLAPQEYRNTEAVDYSIDKTTYKYVDILFYYAVSGQGKLDFTDNALFKSAKWIKSGKNYKLRLYLRKTGAFYGYNANYNESGQLVFRFLNPTKILPATNEYGYSLEGTTIVLDAGHGGSDPGALGADSTKESSLNLMLTQYLKEELEACGANVVLTRSSDSYINLEDRVAIARSVSPDLFISIHRNASDNTSVSGFANYYYEPYSKPLADAVYGSAAQEFRHLGILFYPFYVTRITDCPSILMENGFITNAQDLSKIKSEEFNKKHAKQITQGIVNYFVSIQ